MRTRFHITKAIAVTAALGLALSACSSGGGGESAEPTTGGDLVIARSADATNMVGQETSQNTDIWLLQQIYETLTINKDDGTGVDPGLATEWNVSDDGLTWTFDIRQGVKFHGGQDLTAKDVKWSLDFAIDGVDTNAWAGELAAIKQIDVVDDYTVNVVLNHPWSPLPSALALFSTAIYPADFGGETIDYMRDHTNGTGPFMLDTWTKGQSIKLVKNPNYWDSGYPYLDSVTFTTVDDDNTRMLQLQGGQIQVDEFPAPSSMETIAASAGLTTEAFPSTQVLYFNINNRVITDPKIRRAMSYAVDRESIISTVLSGFGTPANSFLSNALFGHSDSVDGDVYDMDKAKQEMAESTKPDGFDLELMVTSGISAREQIAQIVQQSWGELGINVTIKPVDATTFTSERRAANFDVQIGYVTSDVVDPYQMVGFLVLTDGSGINSGYTNSEVYDLADQAATETDSATREELYGQIQQIVADEAPIIPIAYQPSLFAFSNKVQGFASAALGTYTLKTTSLGQ